MQSHAAAELIMLILHRDFRRGLPWSFYRQDFWRLRPEDLDDCSPYACLGRGECRTCLSQGPTPQTILQQQLFAQFRPFAGLRPERRKIQFPFHPGHRQVLARSGDAWALSAARRIADDRSRTNQITVRQCDRIVHRNPLATDLRCATNSSSVAL